MAATIQTPTANDDLVDGTMNAVLVRKFKTAVDVCLGSGNIKDALLFASLAGGNTFTRVRDALPPSAINNPGCKFCLFMFMFGVI